MRVVLYDTTLRDGSQRAGVSFSVADKVRLARRLAESGVRYIEGGWPGSNPKDIEFFKAMAGAPLGGARLTAFGSTRRAGVRARDDANLAALIDAGTPAVALVGKSWTFHVTTALGTSLDENLEMIQDSVAFCKARGREVVYDAEHFFDGFKADPAYALATLRAAARGGADWLTLCDTNGGSLPHEVAEIVARVAAEFSRDREDGPALGIHTHNDCELAVANTLAGVRAGARMVQGTINGYGERCGNANLISVIPVLQCKLGLECVTSAALADLTGLSHFVSEIANLRHDDGQPFVGRNAFAHKAGIHVSALRKDPSTYEHLAPETVGNRRRVIISELSGRSNLQAEASAGRLRIDGEDAGQVLAMIKELEYQGYQFEGAEASLQLRIRKARPGYRAPFRHEGFRVIVEKREDDRTLAEATVKVAVGERLLHTAAEGEGPVNALDRALRGALQQVFPSLAQVRLTDYKVRVLEGGQGTGARIRVWIESTDGHSTWGTVGVSENIIEASWEALVDSLEHHLTADR